MSLIKLALSPIRDKVTSTEVAKIEDKGKQPIRISRPIDQVPNMKQVYPSIIKEK